MEAGELSVTDIALKTDTAAVLECLQRSMADDDDEDFMLANNSISSYSNHLSRELLSSLPPVSELKADLAPYYADCTLGLRRSAESRADVDLKKATDTGFRATAVPSHYGPATAASVYGPQSTPLIAASEPIAVQFPAGSDFTTLTNASSAQAGPAQVATSHYGSHQQYHNVSGGASGTSNSKVTSSGVHDYNQSDHRQPYSHHQQYNNFQQYNNHHLNNYSHPQNHYYPDLFPLPPPPSYTPATYLAAGTSDSTYHQDAYSPQSGRQSTSCIPSDLQQVTPTIQDLGTPMPSVPPPITPVPQVTDSTTTTTTATTATATATTTTTTTATTSAATLPPNRDHSTASGNDYYRTGNTGTGGGPSSTATLQDIGASGPASQRGGRAGHGSSQCAEYHGGHHVSSPTYYDTLKPSAVQAGFSSAQIAATASVPPSYEAPFAHDTRGYTSTNVVAQQVNHSHSSPCTASSAYGNTTSSSSSSTHQNAYSTGNHYGHHDNERMASYSGVQSHQQQTSSHHGLAGCVSQSKATAESRANYEQGSHQHHQYHQYHHQQHQSGQSGGEGGHLVQRSYPSHHESAYHHGHHHHKSKRSSQPATTTTATSTTTTTTTATTPTTMSPSFTPHYSHPYAAAYQAHRRTPPPPPSSNSQIDYRHTTGGVPSQGQGHIQNASYHSLHTSVAANEVLSAEAIPTSNASSSSFSSYPQQYHYGAVGYHGHTEQQMNGVYQEGLSYPAGLYHDASGAQPHQSQQLPQQQQQQPLASSAQTISGSSSAQMFHDALEYIAPEVITENRDSLFNPIAALTDTLLENNFDMTFPADYQETCDTMIQGTAIDNYVETAAKHQEQRQQHPRKETAKGRNRKRKRESNLLEVIKVYRCNACGFRSSDKLKALRHTIESHSRPKLNRQARFACGACHLHFATLETCCEHVGAKHPAMATAVLKDGKLYKQVLIQVEKRVPKPATASGPAGGNSKIGRAEAEAQAHKIAWKRKMDREQGQYVCELKGCSIRFRLEENHRHHLRCHLPHPSKLERFRCPIGECGLGCKRWSTMANHLWNSHRIDLELQACNRCDFRTYSLANLEKVHKLVHSEEKQFPCEQCQSRFRTIKQLKNHRYMQHSRKTKTTKTVACPHCRQELLKKNLFAHIRQVHEGRMTERNCPQCDFKTTSIAELKSHLSTVHLNESGVHCCHQCGFLTYDHNVYRKHTLKHLADKPYKCAYCSYTSIQATTYKAHLRKNHPERARELIARCPHCSFESISASRLQQHVNKKHNGNHPTSATTTSSSNDSANLNGRSNSGRGVQAVSTGNF